MRSAKSLALAIPTFNSLNYANRILNHDRNLLEAEFDEIVIRDDGSKILDGVTEVLSSALSEKVGFYHSGRNVGALRNKMEAVKLCQSDWVYLLDSDNIFDSESVRLMSSFKKNINTIYSPNVMIMSNGHIQTFDHLPRVIDLETAKSLLKSSTPMAEWLLNLGNFYVNRVQYLSVFENEALDDECLGADVFYFLSKWLKLGGLIEVVREFKHQHTLRPDSLWASTSRKSTLIVMDLKSKLLESEKSIEVLPPSNDTAVTLYKRHVTKGADYFDRFQNLQKYFSPGELELYKGIDLPRLMSLLDFKEWVVKHRLNDGSSSLCCTSDEDPELNYLSIATSRYLKYPPNDLHDLKHVSETFDLFLLNQTLEHLHSPLVALKEINRTIKIGGYFYTTVPTVNIPHLTPIHFQHFTPVGLCTILVSAGFEIVECGYWGSLSYVEYIFRHGKWPGYEDLARAPGGFNYSPDCQAQTWALARVTRRPI